MIERLSRRRVAAALAGVFMLSAAWALPAAAHAILVESTPAVNGTVAAGAVGFTLRFNSRIDKQRSRLTLTAPDKSKSVLPIAGEGAEDVLSATAPSLAPGAYSLRWQVLAIDGHITRGDVPFTVKGE